MKLIIDIPKYVYEACLGHRDTVYQYIAKGTPYEERPRFHLGRLIHPRFGEQDCIFDDARQIYYFDSVTKELMDKYDWKYEEADND